MQKPITLNNFSVRNVYYQLDEPVENILQMTFTDRLEFIHVLDDLSPESVLEGLKALTRGLESAILDGEFLSQNVYPTRGKPVYVPPLQVNGHATKEII